MHQRRASPLAHPTALRRRGTSTSFRSFPLPVSAAGWYGRSKDEILSQTGLSTGERCDHSPLLLVAGSGSGLGSADLAEPPTGASAEPCAIVRSQLLLLACPAEQLRIQKRASKGPVPHLHPATPAML